MADTSRYVNTFIYHLSKNKMAYPFVRQVTSSLDRRGFSTNRFWQKSKAKEFQGQSRSLNKRVSQAQPSSQDKRTESFRIKEGVLGESIRVLDSPRKTQGRTVYDSLKLSDLSPLKASTRNRFRSQSRDKNILKFNSLLLNRKQLMLQEALSRRSSMLQLNRLDLILSTLTGNPNVANLRIYKQTLKKFYICRYSKEKITSFFDYQYIEDYDSQIKILETLLSFKLEQIYYLCFLVLDQNSDGLLCNNDLFLMATVTSKENPLINKDIFKIFQYVTYYRNLKPSITILDSVSDEQEFRSENTNLQRYRLMEVRKEKEKEKSRRMLAQSLKTGTNLRKTMVLEPSSNKNGKKTILTRRTNKHLFSYHKEEDGEAAIKQLRKRFAQIPLESKSNLTFKVNFNTFKTIFNNQIPQTYYDLLYAIGGVELPQKSYLPLNFSIVEPEVKEVSQLPVDRYGQYRQKVTQMRQTYRKSRIQRFLAGSQSLKSLYL